MKSSPFRRVPINQVPLDVVRALANKVGASADFPRLTVGSLSRVTRLTGRGNHSWFVDLLDHGTLRTFRVSWGGRGKRGPTVVEVTTTLLGKNR